MASRSHVDVNERRLRPIYGAFPIPKSNVYIVVLSFIAYISLVFVKSSWIARLVFPLYEMNGMIEICWPSSSSNPDYSPMAMTNDLWIYCLIKSQVMMITKCVLKIWSVDHWHCTNSEYLWKLGYFKFLISLLDSQTHLIWHLDINMNKALP